MKYKKRKGFTLVEMVLVVTILGILSSVALTKFSDVQKRAQLNADYISAAGLSTAVELALNDDKISSNGNIDLDLLVTNGYITSIPKPQSNSNENFKVSIQNNNIVTVSIGDELFYPKGYKETSINDESNDSLANN